jgi:hypothetical protein
VLARGGEARVARRVYALSLSAMFGASALYHRIDWSPRPAAWLRRLDHSMIFVLVAGTYTPFAVLVLAPALGWTVLAVVWGGALVGIVISLLWIDAPRLAHRPCSTLRWAGSRSSSCPSYGPARACSPSPCSPPAACSTRPARWSTPAPARSRAARLRLSRGLPRARHRGRRGALRRGRRLRHLSPQASTPGVESTRPSARMLSAS